MFFTRDNKRTEDVQENSSIKVMKKDYSERLDEDRREMKISHA